MAEALGTSPSSHRQISPGSTINVANHRSKGAGYIHFLKKSSEFISIYDLRRNVVYEININLTQDVEFQKTHEEYAKKCSEL